MKHRITIASLLVALCLALSAVPAVPAAAAVNSAENQRGLILTPDEAHGVTMNLAVQRLRSKSPIRFDLVDGVRDNRTDFKNYDMTIILGVTGAAGTDAGNEELAQAWSSAHARPKEEDAWALKTISTNPLVIVATGNRPRAVLYAVWTLADKLALGEDISSLAMQETPRLEKRYAAVCGTAYGGADPHMNRHTLFMATVDEMPLYGVNGIYLNPGQWRGGPGPGKTSPPIIIGKNGEISTDETKLPAWRDLVAAIKAYDLDVVIPLAPLMPPSFDANKIKKDYIMGGKRPNGYLEALAPFFREYMEKMIEMFPDVDGYVIHAGVEGANYSGAMLRTFLSGQNLGACVEDMEVYLEVADELTRKYNKSVSFWAHQYGINSDGLKAMRQMLFNFPRVTIIEHTYWPTYLWIYGDKLPIMAYLEPGLRGELDKHGNKLGFLEVTDGESFGAGTLPTAIGETFIYSMQEMLKRNTRMVVFRINLHDRSPYGTLWSVSGIQLEQSANQLWDNPLPPDEVWARWIKRLFGEQAAPLVSKALSNDRKIAMAFAAMGRTDLFTWTRYSTPTKEGGWLPKNGKIIRFARPAPLKIPKVVESGDQEIWQLRPTLPSFAEYSRINREGVEEVRRSLALIEQARPMLARADYVYLREIYDNARILLDVVSKLSEVSYAANLVKDNYDNIPDPKAYFDRAIKALETCAASPEVQWLSKERGYVYGDVAAELGKIADAYRKFVAGEKTETTATKTAKKKPAKK